MAPKPSMFIADLLTQCFNNPIKTASQFLLIHLIVASAGIFSSLQPQEGQNFGNLIFTELFILNSFITFTTSGIISPAFLTIIVSE